MSIRSVLVLVLVSVAACQSAPGGAGDSDINQEGGTSASDGGTAESGSSARKDGSASSNEGGALADSGMTTSSPDGGGEFFEVPTPNTFGKFSPAMPQTVSVGGLVLTSPKVQVVSFQGDANSAAAEQLVSGIGSSSYWAATTAEYGVGAATGLPAVHLSMPAPDVIEELGVASFLGGLISAGTVGPNDGQTVYVVEYPSTTTVTRSSDGTTSCVQWTAFHSGRQGVPFVVLPTCPFTASIDANQTDAMTRRLSHELVESATDPLIYTNPAYSRTDDAHFAYWFAYGWEMADMCSWANVGSTVRSTELGGALLARVWSNRFAADHRNPCVPDALAAPYFNSVPVLTDSLTTGIDIQAQSLTWSFTTPVVDIPVGQSKVVAVQLFSDGAISDWSVTAIDFTATELGGSYLGLTFDKTTGNNGDTLNLTIQALATPPGGDPPVFVIESTSQDGRSTRSVGMVAN